MSSSEQVAFAAFGRLDSSDRRLVMAWRDLGNDWVDSLLNSGVLLRHGRRRHPNDAAVAASAERTGEALAQRAQRLAVDESRVRYKTSEHEAAHAVVAMALGMRDIDIRVAPNGDGTCSWAGESSPQERATIAVAGELWITQFRSFEYPEGDAGCGPDRREVARSLDDFGAQRAARRAMEILRDNRPTVLELADRLAVDGVVTFDSNRHAPGLIASARDLLSGARP